MDQTEQSLRIGPWSREGCRRMELATGGNARQHGLRLTVSLRMGGGDSVHSFQHHSSSYSHAQYAAFFCSLPDPLRSRHPTL